MAHQAEISITYSTALSYFSFVWVCGSKTVLKGRKLWGFSGICGKHFSSKWKMENQGGKEAWKPLKKNVIIWWWRTITLVWLEEAVYLFLLNEKWQGGPGIGYEKLESESKKLLNDSRKEMGVIREKKRNKVGDEDDLKGNFCL